MPNPNPNETELSDTSKEFTGAMVGMFLPLPMAVALDMVSRDLPFYVERTKAKDYHLTLAYLGDMQEQNLPTEEIKTAVAEFANTHEVIRGKFGGIGRMSKSDDGKNALYANFDSPELPEFRQDLVTALQSVGTMQDPEHGFIPHITLGYMWDEIEETPYLELPDIEFEIDTITLALGDERLEFELQPAATEKSLAGFSVVQQKDGAYRWVAISSTAYEDRSKEIVSQAALQQAVEINDARSYHGPLRWWHVGGYDRATLKATDGLDIGECDFSWARGKFLVESGTFANQEYAEAAKNLDGQVSIRFLHPPGEPNNEGVYHNIVIFERSLLPRGKSANPFTSFTVQKEKNTMTDEEKAKEFIGRLDDQKLANAVVAELDQRQKSIDDAGVKSKETNEAAGVLAKIKALINPKDASKEVEPVVPVEPETHVVPWVPTEDSMKSIVGAAVAAAIAATQKTDLQEDTEKAVKEAQKNLTSRIQKLETELQDAKKELVEISGAPGHRPSQDPHTVTEKSQTPAGPDTSGVADYVGRVAGGQNTSGVQVS